MKVVRIYARTSSSEHGLEDQVTQLMATASRAGYYVAGTYREFGSGATVDRPELQRLISDLQAGETVIATRMDRISQLELVEAEELINKIISIGASLSVPDVVDLFAHAPNANGIAKIVLEEAQKMMLRLALQSARDSYEHYERGRRDTVALLMGDSTVAGHAAEQEKHDRIVALRIAKYSIWDTVNLSGCSDSEVRRVCAKYRAKLKSIRTPSAGILDQACNPGDKVDGGHCDNGEPPKVPWPAHPQAVALLNL